MGRCGKCNLPVYLAESVQAIGQNFHRHCFICSNKDCGRSLSSQNCCDHKEKPYCVHCHRNLFGPQGVGYGVGAGILSCSRIAESDKVCQSEDRCDLVTSSISYGIERETVAPPLKVVGSVNKKNDSFAVRPSILPQSIVKSLTCSRCQKTVYEAEKIFAAGSVWHKDTCFSCGLCRKRLESRTMCERGGDLFCNNCYARSFGPKGYGHGIGAGTLQLHQ